MCLGRYQKDIIKRSRVVKHMSEADSSSAGGSVSRSVNLIRTQIAIAAFFLSLYVVVIRGNSEISIRDAIDNVFFLSGFVIWSSSLLLLGISTGIFSFSENFSDSVPKRSQRLAVVITGLFPILISSAILNTYLDVDNTSVAIAIGTTVTIAAALTAYSIYSNSFIFDIFIL